MTNPNLKGLTPTHPGELLREDVLPALGKSKTYIADALGVSRMTLHDLLAEKQPLTPNLALRIGKLTSSRPEFWLRMQMNYDLRTLQEQLRPELERIPELAAA